ncbi:MAG: NB-ARC domain-containing protein [Spirosomataceae bacterium]
MNHIQNILKIGGSLGSFALASSIDPSGGFICNAIEAISGNLASNFVAKYDPAALLEFLKKPSELNHDIEKLMIDSVEKAVKLVTVKYLDENPYEDKFVKKTLDQLIKDAKTYSENVDSTIIDTDEDAWVKNINEYIFRGQPDEDGKLAEIAKFFNENLKSSYELVFNEGLKDDKNEKPLKAFLIKSLTGLSEQADKNSEIQQQILAEIQKLKENKPAESLTIAKGYFEAEFKKLNRKLDKVLAIAVKSDGNIELILQILKAFVGNQPTKLPHHLTLPPLVPEVFEGRTDELQNIKKALFESENLLLLVNGEGGIGKTSLAAKYYQQYAHVYNYLAWVLCEQSIADALLTLALPLKLQFDDTATTDQRLAVLLQQMVNLDKPCLLIIDNANEVADLDKNYRLLRQCPNFHILLTSRINTYKNAKFFKVDSLPPEQALAVFREHYPKLQATEEPIFEGIYTAVGGNTLVLELLAKNVALQNTLKTKYSLASLLADLQTKGLLQIVEDDAVNVEYQSYQTAKPTEVIAAMYNLSKLSEAESRLLSVFAVLPAENIAYETLEALLPQTPNLDKTLLSLAQKGWLNHNTTDSSFKCSPVIQEITQAKNQNLYADCEELISVLIDKLDYDGAVGTLLNATYEEGVLYARFAESVIANLEAIEHNLALLCERIGNFYKTHGNIEKAIIYTENYISISKKLVEQYPDNETFKNGLAISYEKLGVLQKSLGNLEKALEYFEDETKLFEELYRDYPNQVSFKNGLAISYEKLGVLQQSLGNLDKALEYFEDETKLFEELYRDYPNQVEFKNGLAISYEKLGVLQKSLGNLDKALEYFEDETKLFEELYRDYPNQVSFKNGLAISYQYLGNLQLSLGSLEEALIHYENMSKLFEELYRNYPNQVSFKNGLAISYFKLGTVYQDNEKQKAIEYFKKAESHWIELTQAFPMYVEFKNNLNGVKNALAGLGG